MSLNSLSVTVTTVSPRMTALSARQTSPVIAATDVRPTTLATTQHVRRSVSTVSRPSLAVLSVSVTMTTSMVTGMETIRAVCNASMVGTCRTARNVQPVSYCY